MLFFLVSAQPKSHTSLPTALPLVHTCTRTDMRSNNARRSYTCVLTRTLRLAPLRGRPGTGAALCLLCRLPARELVMGAGAGLSVYLECDHFQFQVLAYGCQAGQPGPETEAPWAWDFACLASFRPDVPVL